MNFFDAVKDFHTAFRLRKGERPELPSTAERELRMKLLKEEYEEYLEGEETNDLVEIADALADLIYIACGTAVSYGIPLNLIFDEVHKSNMAKLVDGKPLYREDGKVIKPQGWQPPNIEQIIKVFQKSEVRPNTADDKGLTGALGESLVAAHYRELGHEVVISEDSYDRVKDMTVDGKEFEVKTQVPYIQSNAFTISIDQFDKCMKVEGLVFVATPTPSRLYVQIYYYPKENRQHFFKYKTRKGKRMIGFAIEDGILLKTITDPDIVAEFLSLSSSDYEKNEKFDG